MSLASNPVGAVNATALSDLSKLRKTETRRWVTKLLPVPVAPHIYSAGADAGPTRPIFCKKDCCASSDENTGREEIGVGRGRSDAAGAGAERGGSDAPGKVLECF